ncbi:YrhB family protein [Streptomyces avidinii]|uniref:YrhB domain-containing protein n=1 Tax=Streptomyces avidinii TaxID=1895 RepID=UPI0038702EC0|nr:YrhB family protein [Streptomyces avidinii]
MIRAVRLERDEAVGAVEAWLARERLLALGAHRWTPDVQVSGTEEHPLGRLVFCQSAEYIRTRDPEHMLVGLGPILVDAVDGSLHLIPVTTYGSGVWQDLYRHDVKGLPRPDPVASLVSSVLDAQGTVAALREVRRHASGMSIGQAREYVGALAAHQTPSAELIALTRQPEVCPPLPITTLTLTPVPSPPPGEGPDPTRALGYYRELVPGEEQAPSVLPYLRAQPGGEDSTLVSYLHTGTLLVASASATRCRLEADGPSLGSWALLTDGTWFWHSDLAHYVEHHHLQLPPDFVDHARSNSWAPPPLSPQRLRHLEQELLREQDSDDSAS